MNQQMPPEPGLPPPQLAHNPNSASELLSASTVNLREMFATRPHAAHEFLQQYYEHFAKAFPNPAERPLCSRLETRLCDPASPLQIVCVTIGDQIVGGRHFKAFSDTSIPFAAGEFLWVEETYRNCKLGTAIVSLTEELMRRQNIPFFIGEFHDPSICTELDLAHDQQAGMTPEGRLRFWAARGYTQFDAPYVCPPVFGSTEWITNLTLGCRNLTESHSMTSLAVDRYLSILHAYWDSFSTGYHSSPIYRDFMAQFEGVSEIQIIPLQKVRSFHQLSRSAETLGEETLKRDDRDRNHE